MCDFNHGFKEPEMVKCRPVVILSFSDARKGLARLVQDGDLKVERDRGKEYYWLTPLWYRKMT